MPLSDIVVVNITVQATNPVQAGFGEPMILAADTPAGFTQRLRRYFGPGPTATAQLVTDGFSTTSATYLAVSAAFSQSPAPISVAVGKLTNLPTKHFTITPTYVASYTYNLAFDNNPITAASGANLAAACTAIAASITALSIAGVTAAGTGTTVTISTSVAGVWHRLQANDVNIAFVDDTPDPGVTADLNAIISFDSLWYAINADAWGSAAIIASVAAFTEANGKIHVTQTADTVCINQGLTGSDIMQTLRTAAYARSATIYSNDTGVWAGISWLGGRLPKAPGSENWMFATLAGVPAAPLTGSQVANLKLKNGNYYYTVAGINITATGSVANGQFLDLTRGRDWLTSRLQTRIFGVLTSTGSKVPYTDQGIAQIEGEVRAQLKEAIDAGFLASSPAPTVTVPLAAAQSSANRTARILPNVSFQAQGAGAINNVTITGVVLL